MLIPLGILAAAGAGGAAGGPAYELIESAILTSNQSSVTFSSIPQNYKHLQIRFVAKSTLNATGSRNLGIRVNGDTSSTYRSHFLQGSGISSGTDTNTGFMIMPTVFAGDSTTNNIFGAGVIDVLDYAVTTKNKTIRALFGHNAANPRIVLASGFLDSTSAVTSLTILPNANDILTGSRFSLYGIKGA